MKKKQEMNYQINWKKKNRKNLNEAFRSFVVGAFKNLLAQKR